MCVALWQFFHIHVCHNLVLEMRSNISWFDKVRAHECVRCLCMCWNPEGNALEARHMMTWWVQYKSLCIAIFLHFLDRGVVFLESWDLGLLEARKEYLSNTLVNCWFLLDSHSSEPRLRRRFFTPQPRCAAWSHGYPCPNTQPCHYQVRDYRSFNHYQAFHFN